MSNYSEGDLKIWYIPQVPMKPYEVDVVRRQGSTDEAYLENARAILEAIVGLSIFEFDNLIKPDYSDAAGISRLEDGEWNDVEEEP